MRWGSTFSGIGGLDLALERGGHVIAWQVEIDKNAREVLSRRWPSVPIYSDIREVRGADVEAIDGLCGGFPCQDVSLAGRRAGLAGERSGLFYEFARLAAETRARWLIIENVPGLLSSNGGRDMGAVLGTLEKLGYGLAYRVLDAQYFGVPQRRRRVFIVGCLGDWTSAAAVLFEPESVRGYPAPQREAGAVAPTLFASGAGTSRVASARNEADFCIAVSTLQGGGKRGYRIDAEAAGGGNSSRSLQVGGGVDS